MEQFSKPNVSIEESCPSVVCPPRRRRPGGGGFSDVPVKFVFLLMIYFDGHKIPRVGGAEKLKLQEAIPPFSSIEVLIHGRRAETLVKTA